MADLLKSIFEDTEGRIGIFPVHKRKKFCHLEEGKVLKRRTRQKNPEKVRTFSEGVEPVSNYGAHVLLCRQQGNTTEFVDCRK